MPFQFTHLADTAQTYVRELQALLKERQDEVRERNRQIEDGVFAAVADRRRPLKAPAVEDVPPALNFAPLENAANALTRAADRYRKALDAARVEGDAGIGARRQRAADPERASADRSRRSAAAALVSASAVRAGLLHGIRGQDDARRA